MQDACHLRALNSSMRGRLTQFTRILAWHNSSSLVHASVHGKQDTRCGVLGHFHAMRLRAERMRSVCSGVPTEMRTKFFMAGLA